MLPDTFMISKLNYIVSMLLWHFDSVSDEVRQCAFTPPPPGYRDREPLISIVTILEVGEFI